METGDIDTLEKGPVGRPGPLRRKEKRKKVKMGKFQELGLIEEKVKRKEVKMAKFPELG